MSSTLTSYLTGIADAIRAKKGTTEQIPAQNFATEISNLSTGSTLEITDGSYLFYYGARTDSIDALISYMTNLTKCKYMFYGCKASQIDMSTVTTVGLTSMEGMFNGCTMLSSLDISSFDTSAVTNMNSLFKGCANLHSINLSNFNTANVTDMNYMFDGCTSLSTIDLTKLNTSNATSFVGMFEGCFYLTSLDFSSMNTSKLTNINYMFNNCYYLETVNLSCDLRKVEGVWKTFTNCYALTNITFNSTYSFGDNYNNNMSMDLSTTALTADGYVAMINSIGTNNTGYTRTFKLKSTLYSSLTDTQKALATAKNYTLTS